MRQPFRSLLCVCILGLTGCAALPDRIAGPVVSSDPVIRLGQVGETIRWGGVLLSTQPLSDRTCFEILSQSLEAGGRPHNSGDAHQRFIACQPGFVDPEIHSKGTQVTVLGQVQGAQSQQVGQRSIRVPIVSISGIEWWRARPPVNYGAPYGPWGDPFWPLYGPYGWGGYGYGYQRSVIYLRHHPHGPTHMNHPRAGPRTH